MIPDAAIHCLGDPSDCESHTPLPAHISCQSPVVLQTWRLVTLAIPVLMKRPLLSLADSCSWWSRHLNSCEGPRTMHVMMYHEHIKDKSITDRVFWQNFDMWLESYSYLSLIERLQSVKKTLGKRWFFVAANSKRKSFKHIYMYKQIQERRCKSTHIQTCFVYTFVTLVYWI